MKRAGFIIIPKKYFFIIGLFAYLLSIPSYGQIELTTATLYFYNRRGLDVKEFLTKSLLLDEAKGEFISLGLDPNRDRPKDSGGGGEGHGGSGGIIISSGSSSEDKELYQKRGGSLTISAPAEKIEHAKIILAQMDAIPWQIQIETFIVKINKEELERRNIDISGVINTVQAFDPTFIDKTLTPQTFQWVIGNQLKDFGFIRFEDLESEKYIEVTKNPTQRVIHGETSTIIAGERLIFSIASGLSSNIQFADVAFNVNVAPQFIPKEFSHEPYDAVRLEIEIEDATPRTNSKGEVDKIDRVNFATSLIVLNGQMLPLAKLPSSTLVNQNSGIPLLRDIPLIGGIFGSKGKIVENKDYFIFIRATEYNIFEEDEIQSAQEEYEKTKHLQRTQNP